MEKRPPPQPPSSGTTNSRYIDIHEVRPEEVGNSSNAAAKINNTCHDKNERRVKNKPPIRFRDAKRPVPNRSINRQVSLETGFSVLKEESRVGNNERPSLARSGRSLGGPAFGSTISKMGVGEGKRDDFSMFRTKSTLSKQNSLLPTKRENNNDMKNNNNNNNNSSSSNNRHDNNYRTGNGFNDGNGDSVNKSVPAGRYFAALRGPELDEIKEYEDILLPKDERWPFLLRFPIGSFGICLGLSSQAILWKSLSTSPATKFLHIPPYINFVLWTLALLILFLVTSTYLLKCIYYFEAVRREYFHPVRVNFFFAPWVVCMFLAIGAPPTIAPNKLHPAIFCIFMGPVFCLELKIYGQWLSGGKRRLSLVANPSSHLSVVGNFVGSILASRVGWNEPAKFLWAVGFAHYLVLFVTLYQRLPSSEALPKELHPVYSMFIAAPSAASIAWENIYGEFDGLSRTSFFIALFLYTSFVVRINFFWGFRFSVAWWSYTFPMTTASLATIKYAEYVPSVISKGLALTLSFMSSTMVSVLIVSTLLHAFVWNTLFPNDLAIAITKRKQGKELKKKPMKKAYDIRRWTKQAPLSIVSAITRSNRVSKDYDEIKQEGSN